MKKVQQVRKIDKVRLVRYLDCYVGATTFSVDEVSEIHESAYSVMARYRRNVNLLSPNALFEAIHHLLAKDKLRPSSARTRPSTPRSTLRRGLFFQRGIHI